MARKHNNPLHLNNFSNPGDAFEIIDISPFKAGEVTGRFLISTGRTLEEAKERFYMRYMIRGLSDTTEKQIIERAQARGNLVIHEIIDNQTTLVERNPLLIAMV